ncbi:hypothetical protein [Kribbella soli]|uniref:Uncharacterized protein n=1 Tax=Kribbella soli TaxID=1124743 RepID=A0A4R0HAK3_9ACTN|nr:hypothetical protein [Kribbella soli]TCC07173.1 hypothetical protein E0H45_14225 [Kribbella soli]
MNAAPAAVATAAVFIWLGMVLAISFLETPLKFRAPGVDIPIGLGIGRIVFRTLNRIEIGPRFSNSPNWPAYDPSPTSSSG